MFIDKIKYHYYYYYCCCQKAKAMLNYYIYVKQEGLRTLYNCLYFCIHLKYVCDYIFM